MDYVVLKSKAIDLRKKGATYSEILKTVNVAKSTLSLWLRSVGLAKRQIQRNSEKRRQGSLRGAQARKDKRILITKNINLQAKSEIGILSNRELFLIGIALYWAEGSKEKASKPGSKVQFCNSDPLMINLFIKWLIYACNIKKEEISFEIYVHESYKSQTLTIKDFWRKTTGFEVSSFDKVYWKKHKIKTNRKNIGNMYNGVLRVNVRKSSVLLRKIQGWILGISAFNS